MQFSSEFLSLSFHTQFGCLSILTENFRAAFTTKDKKRCKPSSLDLFNAHLRQRSQYGVQTNIFEELRMLPSTKIMVSENFNPTLGTMGQFFLACSGDASRSTAGRAHEKALTPRAILIRTRSRNLENVSEVLFCGFLSVSEARSERFAAKVSDLKARVLSESLCSIDHSFFVSANDSFKKNADIARESREILRTIVWQGAPICPPPILWGIYIFRCCRRITFTVSKC